MSLFWLVYKQDGNRVVYIVEAAALVHAWMRAAIAGFAPASRIEGHELDDKTARKVPRKMIGRVLSQDEARTLLERMG